MTSQMPSKALTKVFVTEQQVGREQRSDEQKGWYYRFEFDTRQHEQS